MSSGGVDNKLPVSRMSKVQSCFPVILIQGMYKDGNSDIHGSFLTSKDTPQPLSEYSWVAKLQEISMDIGVSSDGQVTRDIPGLFAVVHMHTMPLCQDIC